MGDRASLRSDRLAWRRTRACSSTLQGQASKRVSVGILKGERARRIAPVGLVDEEAALGEDRQKHLEDRRDHLDCALGLGVAQAAVDAELERGQLGPGPARELGVLDPLARDLVHLVLGHALEPGVVLGELAQDERKDHLALTLERIRCGPAKLGECGHSGLQLGVVRAVEAASERLGKTGKEGQIEEQARAWGHEPTLASETVRVSACVE